MRNIAAAAAGCGLLLFLVLRPDQVGSSRSASVAAPDPAGTSIQGMVPTPAAQRLPRVDSARRLVSYAVPTTELQGLPPDLAPGSAVDVWVAWEPPITDAPEIQQLITDATLEEIVPPILPEGPHVALLLVTPEQVTDLLYGDRYGALSVTMPAPPTDPNL